MNTDRRGTRVRSRTRKPWLRSLAALALLGQSLAFTPAFADAPAAVTAQAPEEEPIIAGGVEVGRFFRQTGGGTGNGYAVREPFWSALQALGGTGSAGFPVSSPFRGTDGCLYQDFQVVLLQQCAPGGEVVRANTFQILEENGADARLDELGITRGEGDSGSSFQESVNIRLSWLEDAAIREKYLTDCGNGDANAAVQVCGLPMNRPTSVGPFLSQRFQRVAFQRWLVAGPGGITPGFIARVLGGDLLKDTGVLAGPVTQPHAITQQPAEAIVGFANVGSGQAQTGGGSTFRDRATLGIVANPVEAAPRANPASFGAAREGQDLGIGDVVRAPGTGNGLITYFTGTTTEVSPGTTLLVEELAPTPQGGVLVTVRQVAGQAIHRVGQLLNGGQFRVATPDAVAVVRGTIFRTTVLPNGSTIIEVFEGSVGVGNAGIQAGQYAIIDANGNVSSTGAAPAPGQPPAPPANPPATGGAGPAAPAAQARTQPLQYGFQGDFFVTARRPQTINLIKDAGFGWAKQQIVWDQYEIDQATCVSLRPFNQQTNSRGCIEALPGRYFKGEQLGFLDAVMNDLSASGLKVMVSVVRAPTFLAAPGGHAPADPNRLGDFITVILNRYKGKVQAIEPWNEQNLSWEWGSERLWPNRPASPPQGVVDFVALQEAAFNATKRVDGGVIVVLPALTPTGLAECWENPEARTQSFCTDAMKVAIDDRLYLDFMYQVRGGAIKNFYDVLGVHPSGYNNAPDDWVDRQSPGTGNGFKGHGSFYIKRYQQLREVQLKYGDTKPMWFTEVGWSSTSQAVGGYEYGQDNTEEERGKYFARMLEQLKNEAPYVTNLFVWNLNFRMLVGPGDEKYGFGVVDASGNPLPAYNCMRDFVRNGERITQAACRP